MLGGATVHALGEALVAFVRDHLLAPVDSTPAHALLEAALADIAPTSTALSGHAALEWIAGALGSVRTGVGRFGEPAVYLGTVRGAVGLPFAAVRVLGLAEGTIPAAPREDPVLPSALRARVGGLALARPSDVVTSQLVVLVSRGASGAV